MSLRLWKAFAAAVGMVAGRGGVARCLSQSPVRPTTVTPSRQRRIRPLCMCERLRAARSDGWTLPKGPAWMRRRALSARFWKRIELQRPLVYGTFKHSGRKCPRCKLRITGRERLRRIVHGGRRAALSAVGAA